MIRSVLLLVFLVIVGFLLGPIAIENPTLVIGLAVGIFLAILSMLNFEKGIMFLFFIIPFSVQLNLKKLEKAPVDIGLDDVFIFLLALVWFVYLGKTKQAPFVKNPLTWPFISYLAACLLSFIPMMISQKGNIPLSLLHLFKWFEYVFLYFIMLKCLDNRSQIIRFTMIPIGIACIVALMQLFQILTHVGLTEDRPVAAALFESQGILGAYYVFFLSVTLSFLIRLNLTTNQKILLAGVGVLMACMLFLTYSRAAYLGFGICLVLTAVFNRRAAFFLTLFALLIAPIFMSRRVSQEIKSTVRYEGISNVTKNTWRESGSVARYYAQSHRGVRLDLSSVVRLISWAKARKVIYHHPLLGTGYWSARFLNVFGFSTVHSWYLTVLLETGVLGFLAFLWLCGAILWNSFLLFHKTQDEFYQALALGYLIGFIGILVHCFFGETFESFRLTGPLWMTTGILISAKRIEELGQKEQYHLMAA